MELLFIAVDHSLFLLATIYTNQQMLRICSVNESEFFHSYLIANRNHLKDVIPYHVAEFPVYEFINILMTFAWNFIDLFIILICVGLVTRFDQINFRIIDSRSSNESDENFWMFIRVHYYSMVGLVDEVDKEVSFLILLSTGQNLFSLCVTIYQCLKR